MKIVELIIKPFDKKLKYPLKTSSQDFYNRQGLIIKIISDEGFGYGEASPLFGFSPESLKEASYTLEGYRSAVVGLEETSFDELISLVDLHSNGYPSVEFGLDTALYDMFARINGNSLSKFLNPNAYDTIKSNGIVGIHNPGDNFSSMKVKIGKKNLFDELNNLDDLSNSYGDNISFRLDANGSMDLNRAIRFCKEIERFNIDYIEQPIPKNQLEDLAELRYHTDIPIAVDESLTNFQSAQNIIEFQAADILIIKPTISGRFDEIKNIINLSNSENLRTVITSSLETNIGLSACAHLASANLIKDACGLSTFSLFENNNELPFCFKNGIISLTLGNGIGPIFDIN